MQSNLTAAVKTEETEFQTLLKRLTSARSYYDDLLGRLNSLGHRIEDTNFPKASEDAKKMKESPRPGIFAELTNEVDLLHAKNDWLSDIVNKLERLF